MSFCEDSRVEGHLDDGLSGTNEGIVNQSSKSPIIHVIDESEGDENCDDDTPLVERHLKAKKRLPSQTTAVEELSSLSHCRYSERVCRPLGEWWKNHIFPQGEEEEANVALWMLLLHLVKQ